MPEGFMKLEEATLKLLDDSLTNIDIQYGCPGQCIGCGVGAVNY